MTAHAKEYLFPADVAPQAVKDLIAARLHCVEEPAEAVRRRFFDDFDWGAYLAGGAIEERRAGSGHELIWHDLSDEGAVLPQAVDAMPAFARDLPPGALRDKLTAVVGLRRLLPLVTLDTELRAMRLLGDDDNLVARLVIEESRLDQALPAASGRSLAARLRLISLRGQEAAFAEVDGVLRGELGLVPARASLLQEALGAAGRRPADYSSKIDYELDPNQRADAAAKEILLGLLDTLEANIPGVRANLDAEFLHDLRVATRRTRCALGQIKGVFPPDLVAHYKEGFAWVQAVTGKVRDLDVYLSGFEGYQRSLPARLQPHLEPLRAFLLEHYAETQETMVRELDSPRFSNLLKEWRVFLGAPVPRAVSGPNARRPAKAVADACIWRLVRRVRREGRAITPDAPPEDLHEARKSCKKLRYLMEFFQSLYAGEEIRDLVKQLKVLLDNLGGFQDLTVQGAHLTEIARQMREEGGVSTDSLLAMGALIGDICARQERAREKLAELFAAYDQKENRRRFKALFASRKSQEGLC
jgi:CHAD domain-containing protein